jgi:hypothetical protein
MTLPAGATVYAKRAFPAKADELPTFLGRELGNVERAIKDTAVRPVRAVTAAFTVTLDDGLVLADGTAGAFAVTLPNARIAWGRTFVVKRTGAAGTITVTAAGTATIDGIATYALTVQYQSVSVQSDGVNWWIL